MEEKKTAASETPERQKNLLGRWSFFFIYLLIFPVLLQLLFGAYAFSCEEWLNWLYGLLFRGVLGASFIFAATRLPHRMAPLLMGAVCLCAGVFNLMDIFLLINFGTLFDFGTFQLMRIAPGEELRGFFQLFFLRLSTWSILLLYPAAGLIIFKVRKGKLLWGMLLLFTTAILLFFNCTARKNRSAVFSPAARMKNFLQAWQNSRRAIRIDTAARLLKCSNSDPSALCLLIIGESHSRRRSSLYGAPRETTPYLKKLYQEQKIFRFDNSVTPHVMTHLALPGMITLAGADIKNFQNYPTVPDIFRKAGFKVWYIYNQMPDQESALPFLAAAKRADHFVSLSNPVKVFDSRMIGELKKIYASPAPKKFIILHLRGNHWKYAETFPGNMRYFSKSKSSSMKQTLINEYDDSLRSLDSFLADVIKLTRAEKENGFILYLPDHGEALYEEDDFAGHTDLFPTAATAELPMFLWLSKEFARPELIPAINKSVQKPFLSSDLPHLLLELSGIQTAHFDPERSLINPRYKKIPRRVSTRGTDYDTMKNRSFPTSERQ